jgi:hypothetical protein
MIASQITRIHTLFNELQRELGNLNDEIATHDLPNPLYGHACTLDAMHHDVQIAIDHHIEANDLVQTVAGNYRPRAPIAN